MNDVRVLKSELLDKLKANRENHRKVFLEAQAGFRDAVIKAFEANLSAARKGSAFRQNLQLVEPVDKTEDYDRAISMLEWSQDEYIEINERSFAEFVLDQWAWSQQFYYSNSGYSETARRHTSK